MVYLRASCNVYTYDNKHSENIAEVLQQTVNVQKCI